MVIALTLGIALRYEKFSYSAPKYKYTYFIDKEPIDVYIIAFQYYLPALRESILYFRTNKTGNLIPEVSKDGWVTTSCDKE